MCLKVNLEVVVPFDEHGDAILYKVITWRNDRWTAPCECTDYPSEGVPDFTRAPKGMLLSNRDELGLTNHEIRYGRVSYGIHVFTNYQDAENYRVRGEEVQTERVALVRCRQRNLVAAGNPTVATSSRAAVFTEVEFTGEFA